MPRDAARALGSGAGVYRWLLAREQAAELVPGRALAWTHELPGYQGSAERAAALRGGEPVVVFAGCLPKWARDGVNVSALTYARVDPSSSIEFSCEAMQFADESNL